MIRKIALIALFVNMAVCLALAAGPAYDINETIKKGKQVILEEKERLEEREKTEEEKKELKEIKEEEARREIYEQRIIEEAAMPRETLMLERQLQRERVRRSMMTAASREAEVPFKLRKRFNMRLSETYDDNVFLAKTNKKRDYITTVSPSVLFTLSSKFAVLDLNYVMDITRYKDQNAQSGVSHLVSTYIRPGTLGLPFFNRRRGKIGLELQDDFQPFVTSVASSEQTSRTDRTYNKFFLAADYYMSAKRTLALEYTNILQSYHSVDLETNSYTENTISPTFYFHARQKWSFLTGYDYGIIDYSKGDRSSVYQRLKAGVTGTTFTKVLTHLEVGKEWREYEDPKNGQAQKMYFKSALINKFTPATTGSLRFDHVLHESTYSNNPYYIGDEFRVYLEHKFSYKTMGILGFNFIRNSYDRSTAEDGVTKKREDTIWQPTLGLKYHLKRWLAMDVTYVRVERSSNFGKFDYVDNRFSGGVNAKF
ncbi:MAG: outer membrane beta-barrel protein [Candidatus Omnitrophica bacterium]|nr:outer membrane beta-barrel protein [Candidatus Omnitrophota bacterium]